MSTANDIAKIEYILLLFNQDPLKISNMLGTHL